MRPRRLLGLACLAVSLGSCSGSNSSAPSTDAGGSDRVNTNADGGASDGGASDSLNAGAVVKLCNPLSTASGGDITLSLDVGMPPVTLTASSGVCVPAKAQPCVQIPAGMNVPLAIRMGTQQLATAVMEKVEAGDELLIYPDLDNAGNVTVAGGSLIQDMMPKCSELAFGDIFQVP